MADTKEPNVQSEREALDAILKAADDCEYCIRNDWGAAAKDELATIRRLVRSLESRTLIPAQAGEPVAQKPGEFLIVVKVSGPGSRTITKDELLAAIHFGLNHHHGHKYTEASFAVASAAATPPQEADALDDEQIRAVAKRIKMPKIFWDTQNFREWLGKFYSAVPRTGSGADALDARRYRWLREGTRAIRGTDNYPAFSLRPFPIPNVDIMRGSVAQHLDAAIDSARGA